VFVPDRTQTGHIAISACSVVSKSRSLTGGIHRSGIRVGKDERIIVQYNEISEFVILSQAARSARKGSFSLSLEFPIGKVSVGGWELDAEA
jgi:hypothetical protein